MERTAAPLVMRSSAPIRIDAGPFELKMMARLVGDDHGGTLEVYGVADGERRELLKFDCFELRPHWHRCYPGRPDEIAQLAPMRAGQALAFAMATLRGRFGELIGEQGFASLAEAAGDEGVAAAFAQAEASMAELIRVDPSTL